VEGAVNGRFSGGFCDCCHDLIDPAVGGGMERIDGSGLWCGLCSATAPADSSTRSDSPPGRSCWRCWTPAARTSWSAKSAAEAVDPEGRQWPRTKRSDDATAVYLTRTRTPTLNPEQAAWDGLPAVLAAGASFSHHAQGGGIWPDGTGMPDPSRKPSTNQAGS
jgi:hypothetical protein